MQEEAILKLEKSLFAMHEQARLSHEKESKLSDQVK